MRRRKVLALGARGLFAFALASALALAFADGVAAQTGGAAAPRAKRVAPPEVRPVTMGGVRYEVLHWGKRRSLPQNGGYIIAVDVASGRELWVQRIYELRYDAAMESDVQDRFISSLRKTFFGSKLKIEDEAGNRFLFDPATRVIEAR